MFCVNLGLQFPTFYRGGGTNGVDLLFKRETNPQPWLETDWAQLYYSNEKQTLITILSNCITIYSVWLRDDHGKSYYIR